MNSSNETLQLDQLHSCSFRRSHRTGMPEWQLSFLTSEMSAILISLTIINLLLSPCTIFFNTLVMIAVKTTPRLRNKYNGLLACLAGTDLLTGAFGQPVFIAKQIYRLKGSIASGFCSIQYMESIFLGPSIIASVQQLAIISFERYIAIKYPYRYHDIITQPRLIGAVLTNWSFAVFPSFISLFLNNSSVFLVLFRVLTMVPGTCALIFCHIAVYREARKQSQKIKTQQVSVEAKQTFLKESKALKTTSFVLGAVLASIVPMTFFKAVLQSRISSSVVLFALEAAFFSLALWNSVCNPSIYCARSSEYRTAFKKLLRLKQNQVQPTVSLIGLQET